MKLRGSGSFFKALKRTHQLAKTHDVPMRGYVLLLAIYAVAIIMLPLITVYVIDSLVQASNFRQFVFLASLLLFANIIKAVFRAVINIYTTRREFQYGKELEWILIDRFFEKKGEFYIKNATGDMMEVIMDDSLLIAEFTYGVYRTVADLINSIAILAVLAYLQWDLALILMTSFPFILLIQNNLEWKLDDWYGKFRDEMARENSLSEEFVSNAALIAAHGIKEKCRRKYREMLARLTIIYKKAVTLSHVSFGALECSIFITIFIATVYEGYKVFNGTATIGILVAFVQYSDFLVDPGKLIAALRVQGNKLGPSLNRFDKIYEDSNTSEADNKPEFKNFDIEFDNVGFYYPDGKRVFDNATVKMESHRTHVIVGASGQGKTTMISLITGLWDATEGTISLGGHPIEKINLDYLRKHISLVSQDNLFFHETIRDNLEEEEGKHTEAELYEALRKAGMMEEVLEMPNKLDTELGDRGYSLSGGQRQRLAIARALLKNAPVIIFDEPTSALDEGTEYTILNTIKELSDKTILIITHRKSLMDIGDYRYEIRGQKIVKITK